MQKEATDTLQQDVERVTLKIGTSPLSDDDICTLVCREIARSYAYEEKGHVRQ